MTRTRNGFTFTHSHGSVWVVTFGGAFFARVSTIAVIRALR